MEIKVSSKPNFSIRYRSEVDDIPTDKEAFLKWCRRVLWQDVQNARLYDTYNSINENTKVVDLTEDQAKLIRSFDIQKIGNNPVLAWKPKYKEPVDDWDAKQYYVLIDRGGLSEQGQPRYVVATANEVSIKSGEWFWGHYFYDGGEARTYFESLEQK